MRGDLYNVSRVPVLHFCRNNSSGLAFPLLSPSSPSAVATLPGVPFSGAMEEVAFRSSSRVFRVFRHTAVGRLGIVQSAIFLEFTRTTTTSLLLRCAPSAAGFLLDEKKKKKMCFPTSRRVARGKLILSRSFFGATAFSRCGFLSTRYRACAVYLPNPRHFITFVLRRVSHLPLQATALA